MVDFIILNDGISLKNDDNGDDLVVAWDYLIDIIQSFLKQIINSTFIPEVSNLIGVQKVSMIIFGFARTITDLRVRHINSSSNTFRNLITVDKLNEFYTNVCNFQDKLVQKFLPIQTAFENLYQIRFPDINVIPKIINPRFHSDPEIHQRKSKLLEMIEDQIRFYPLYMEKIDGINDIVKEIGSSKPTIINWIKKYLEKRYGIVSNDIYKEIWSSRSALSRKITYNRIRDYIEKMGGELLTTEKDFNAMEEYPSERTVKVGHKKNKNTHIWTPRVRYLLYYNYWCPYCHEFKTEESMRLIMEAIFRCKFKKTYFKYAFNESIKEVSNLCFDGFSNKVYLHGKVYQIAFEYDGLQHDFYPNLFHKSKLEFDRQQKNDKMKNFKSENKNTILIRLKAKNGYTFKTRNHFEIEILRQFFEQTGIEITPKNLIFDKNNSLRSTHRLDKFLT